MLFKYKYSPSVTNKLLQKCFDLVLVSGMIDVPFSSPLQSDCQWSNAAFNLTENNAFAVRDVEMAVTLPTQSPFNSAIKEVVDEDVYPSESYAFTFLPMVNRSFLNMTEMDVVDELAPCLFAPVSGHW